MKGKTVYFLFTDTGTYLTRVINFVTKQPLNHVSIAFDPALQEVYSFGRKRPRNPFIGGFVKEDIYSDFFRNSDCAIYAFELTEEECSNVKKRIAEIELRKHNYKYNFLGLLGVLIRIELNRENALFCSQFVATVLSDVKAIRFHKPNCFITPADIRNHEGMQLIYQGTLEDYQCAMSRKFEQMGMKKQSLFFSISKKVKQLVIK
ncbi:hypothetical protein SAMN04488072_104231 [Lentibacillus halodurans]|uniref:Permuted papain-like amidase enzyme, YaeF/YiiX, C92 family n=1 Tax=Lentibacillus halodurans TaxID=237679 RepID=A0A1I0X9J8_9BACI|nr:hypothetical protein [Lentibacillus halodurans]SFA97096.1 hypothetical protein SAMN04488072_104231 [Lentibacillus halodurans]